jgi:predicted metal-dependent hydrolase
MIGKIASALFKANEPTVVPGQIAGMPCRVRRSHRARRVRVSVGPAGVELVVPERASLRRAVAFLMQQEGWIAEQMLRLRRRVERRRARQIPLAQGHILLRGRPVRVDVKKGSGAVPVVQELDAELRVLLPENGRATAAEVIEHWMRGCLREELGRLIGLRAQAMGVRYGRVSIRGQKTRWASCAGSGNLSFNWRLMMAPPGVLDYIVVHELAHRLEANHSHRFWGHVAAHCADYRVHNAWLKTQADLLHQLLPQLQ